MKIHFFGCSFTEGGGLDNLEYYNSKTNSNLKDYNSPNSDILRNYKEANRYSKIVGDLLGVETKNYAVGCNSNENILNKAFEVVNGNTITDNDVFIIQTSISSRKHFWYEPTNEFYSINTLDFSGWPYSSEESMKPLNTLYNLYYQYCYNEEYEVKKLLNQIDLFNSYFKEKNIKLFWLPWPELTPSIIMEEIVEFNKNIEDKNIILFDGFAMGTFASNKKLLICDEFKNITDRHKSTIGHKTIANKIVEFLKERL
jgi:hypothetical protein